MPEIWCQSAKMNPKFNSSEPWGKLTKTIKYLAKTAAHLN